MLFFNKVWYIFLTKYEGGVPVGGFNRVDATANRIKSAMAKAGKKQADIVRETGINRSAISRYLSGEYEPKQDAVHKMAKCLGVSEMWLWGYECPIERTETQKKNDALSDIVVRLRSDNDFLSIVEGLNQLEAAQLASVKQIVDAFLSARG